ncbi:MAG: hypothetical protein ABI481_12725, partial [Pyrinomonadaceae bacterium]
MKPTLIALLILTICAPAVAAQDAALWKGVAFGMSSAAVIEKAGKPRSVKVDKASFQPALSSTARERNDLRIFAYERADGWKKIVLSFLDDKLIGVELWPKNKTIEASSLPAKFHADFLLVEAFAKGVDL